MAATVIDEGRDLLTKRLLGQSTSISLQAKLYVNNHTPVATDTDSNFTVCPGTTGYADQNLTATNWTGSTSSGLSTYTYPTLNFVLTSNTGASTIYGYWIRETNATKAAWAELFSTAFVIPAAGGTVTLNLTWKDN